MQRRRRVMVIFAVIALGQTTGSIVQRSNSAEIAARDMTFEVVLVGGAVLGLLAAACHLPIRWVARITLAFCGAALLMIMAAHGGIGGFDEASLLVLPAISSLVLGSRDTLFFLVRDTELSEEKLRAALAEQPHAAHHDALTRLANRAAVAQWAGASHDKGDPLRVFLVDLDGFKGMNDAFGHAAGDETLATMAAQLKMSAPAGSLVARLGATNSWWPAPWVPEARSGMTAPLAKGWFPIWW